MFSRGTSVALPGVGDKIIKLLGTFELRLEENRDATAASLTTVRNLTKEKTLTTGQNERPRGTKHPEDIIDLT